MMRRRSGGISRGTQLPSSRVARSRVLHAAVITLRQYGWRVEHLGGRSWRLKPSRGRGNGAARTLGSSRLVALAASLSSPTT